MEKLSGQHVKALLWFHFLNQLRRIFATYVFPLLVIGFGALIAFVHYKSSHAVEYSADSIDQYDSTKSCTGSGNLLFQGALSNQTVAVAVYDSSISRDIDFR